MKTHRTGQGPAVGVGHGAPDPVADPERTRPRVDDGFDGVTAKGTSRPDAGGADAIRPKPQGKVDVARVLDALWTRRHDVAMQPHPGSAWLAVSEPAPLERLALGPDVFVKGLYEVMLARPAGASTTSSRSKTTEQLRDNIRAASRGEMPWSRLARERVFFARVGTDDEPVKEQVILHVPPEHVAEVMAHLTEDVLDAPHAFDGVLRVEVDSPYTNRPGNLSIGTAGGAATARLLEHLERLVKRWPDRFVDRMPPLTRRHTPKIARVQTPDPARYPTDSFRSVRTQVLHGVAIDAAARGLDRAEFEALFFERFRCAGLDPEAPETNLQGALPVQDVAPVPLPGAVRVEAGRIDVEIPGFDGEPVPLTIEITDEVAALIGRRDNVRFLPEQGLFAKVDVDRTRNPPRERVHRQFVASFVDDTRYRLDFSEKPPPFVTFDAATGAYHVPRKVTLAPLPRGAWGNYRFDVELDEARPGRTPPARPHLVEQLADPKIQGDRLGRVMARIDAYVRNPDAGVSTRVVLEEGTNGVSVVGLDNRGSGVWKPSAAEYPEQARVHLEPDHQARREAFAYFLSRMMGHIGRVPPTVYREFEGEPGAICALSRGTLPGSHAPQLDGLLADPTDPSYRDIAVFDCLIGNLDRHSGNVLFGDGVVLAIDHGLAFPLEHGEQGEANFLFERDVPLSPEHARGLEALLAGADDVRAEAERLDIAPAAVDLVFARARGMLERGATYADWRTGP